MDKNLNEFKEWFAIHYPEYKDYLEITFFDYDKGLFVAKDTWNPDSVIAAKVLRITLKAWQHKQAKVEELQKQFDQHDKLLLQRNKDVQELYDINAKHVAEKAELQKRVDEQGLIIAKVMSIASDLQQSWAMFEIGKKLEQALKGEV
ncbi:hypothetical protein [Acinetobacter baumannii]|uniref:hypothetical protein n=1 Tax=Acinetobacter baumannii TaxID=470 RepID=UPI0007D8A314|nr:hypothetical protein [Acinetobacter baumannii]EKT7961233.1 hypothetical protein [Acinetobacter baumannii]EKU0427603.1 hypothetical protein [Acinetobacter baumannii]EKV4645968.1 hypothetical protein [Acinetobacter baumannii]EKV6479710.1 hypothetical protein [Acinetobacter baumannii]EKV9223760.1 hypothetical protein [Acinetobacter baumannii]